MRTKPEKNNEDKPECANWKVWLGKEVEGIDDLGVTTLFTRELGFLTHTDVITFLSSNSKVNRFWFCKEYLNYACIIRDGFDEIYECLNAGIKVCLELRHDFAGSIPADILSRCKLYYRIPEIALKAGDHVSWGEDFNYYYTMVSESDFNHKNNPKEYREDIKIL